MITQVKQLEDILETTQLELAEIGFSKALEINVPIVFNHRLTKALGRCVRKNGNTIIDINVVYARTESLESVKRTVMHEMIHVLTPGAKHGGDWKRIVDIVNRRLGYDISRLATTSNEYKDAVYGKPSQSTNNTSPRESRASRAKYKIHCSGCDRKVYRMKSTVATRNLENYHCPKCKGKLSLEVL